MKYSEKDMAALISEVEAQFAEHLAKSEKVEEETLSKSEEVEEVLEASENSTEVVEEVKLEKSEEQSEEVVEFDYDDEDLKEMETLYSSMSKSEAEAHLSCLAKVLGIEGQEEVSADMQKSESEEAVEVSEDKEDEISLMKSEIEAIKKENEELKKSAEALVSKLNEVFVKKSAPAAPKQKAITKIEYIAKSEEDVVVEDKKESVDVSKLSKNEITSILTGKIREGRLEKKDREAIDSFYLENKNIDTIKHLLV